MSWVGWGGTVQHTTEAKGPPRWLGQCGHGAGESGMPPGVCGGFTPPGDTRWGSTLPPSQCWLAKSSFPNPLSDHPHEHIPVLGSSGLTVPVTQNPIGLPAPALAALS